MILQGQAQLGRFELQKSAKDKGHYALYNCFMLGHTEYNGIQRVFCNKFPIKLFLPSIVMREFIVLPDFLRYAPSASILGSC
jgi:hypothetical protein